MLSHAERYSTGFKFVFWILWCLGGVVCFLFGIFSLLTISKWAVFSWNLLAVLAEVFILSKTVQHFSRKDRPASELLLWVASAAFAIPLIASGGCVVIGNSLRIGG